MRSLFLAFLASLAVTATLATEYVDLLESRPDDGSVRILATGDKYTSFARDGPFVLDPQFLQEYGSLGYLHVHYKPNGDNSYKGSSSQYVASIKDASVCGSEGDVWDDAGNLYRMNTWVRHPLSKLEAWRKEAQDHGIKRYKRLASAVHRVSFMYFHFMAESLPRIAKFKPFLDADPELKLLTYGTSFEQAWLQKLGIRSEQVITFDPLFAYHADELLVSNPVEIARTPREDLLKMLDLLGLPSALPADQQTDLVYVSRRLASDRIQTNEDALLEALQAEASAQGLRLVIHDGNPSLTVDDTVEMFRRAKVVMGPNGAGLAHMMFAPPGAILVELMFINNTGMDLWHMTNALSQEYYMVPLPRSHWLDPGSDVPIEQAISTLRWALGVEQKKESACPHGSAPQADGSCMSCPPGTFATGYDSSCMPCSAGWVAERTGSGFCHICLPNTYAADSTTCHACPAGMLAAMPGSTKADECLDPETLEEVKRSWLPTNQVVAKVSAYFQAIARRRSSKELDFQQLDVTLKDRILSEIDTCSSYSKYSTYGCTKSSPPPPPSQTQVGTTTSKLSVRALGNGPLSSCAIAYYDDNDDLVAFTSKTNATGFASLANVTTADDWVVIELANCTEASLNRTLLPTITSVISIPPNGGLTVLVSPIAELATYDLAGVPSNDTSDDADEDLKAGDFFKSYVKMAGLLGIPAAAYGTPANFTNFDYFSAAFNSTDPVTVTKGTMVFVVQTMVHGISDVWSSGLAGTNRTDKKGSIGLDFAYSAYMAALYDTLDESNSTHPVNLTSSATQKAIANLAQLYAMFDIEDYENNDEEERHRRRSLLQSGISTADLYSAIADSVAASVALQTAALARLAAAVSSGQALSAADLNSILASANQAALAQRRVSQAAAAMAAGQLSVASFREQYTGDALLAIFGYPVYHKKNRHVGAIVGGTIGGFFGLVLIIVLVVVLVRRNKQNIQPKQQPGGDVEQRTG